MTHPPFRSEVLRLRRWCGDPLDTETGRVVSHLEPIRSRRSLLSSFAREASPSEPVRTAYAIRWIELGTGIVASGVSRARRRRVIRPVLRSRR
ncbi:MAG TPA: hypothetical protein VGI98_01090 [Candidatus Limnocylindrales bacterium]|jgi:hypothetical protein